MRRCRCCWKVEIRFSTSFKRAPVFLATNLQNAVEIISNLVQTPIHYLYHESRNNTWQSSSSSSSKISSVLLLCCCYCSSSLTSRKLELPTSNKNHIFHETDLFCHQPWIKSLSSKLPNLLRRRRLLRTKSLKLFPSHGFFLFFFSFFVFCFVCLVCFCFVLSLYYLFILILGWKLTPRLRYLKFGTSCSQGRQDINKSTTTMRPVHTSEHWKLKRSVVWIIYLRSLAFETRQKKMDIFKFTPFFG
jgi:hypothetical protein